MSGLTADACDVGTSSIRTVKTDQEKIPIRLSITHASRTEAGKGLFDICVSSTYVLHLCFAGNERARNRFTNNILSKEIHNKRYHYIFFFRP